MGFSRRQTRRSARRGTDWHNADITTTFFQVVAGVQLNISLWTPALLDEDATVVRIVGTIFSALQVPDDVTGLHHDTLNMGIQIVNRSKGIVGTERSPAIADDREGSEWMWMGQNFHASNITDGTENPPNSWVKWSESNGYNPYIDIRVKRKIDKSQDEILLSFLSTNNDWSCSSNIRMLIMQK